MQESCKRRGQLHGNSRVQRQIGGFTVTEGIYPSALTIGRHDHELASICIVLAGAYDEHFGHKCRRAEPGTVIIHPEGEYHEEVHDPVCTKLLTIEIDRGLLQDLRPEIRAFDDAWHRTDYAAAEWAYRMCFEISRIDSASALAIESSIFDMLASLDGIRLPRPGQAAWLSRVQDRLEAEFQCPPTIKELSDLAGVHPVHLARAFKRRFGCSIGAYVRRLRIGKAVLSLEDHTRPLSAVAYEAGFADQSHMTRLVGAHTGLTPGGWRRRGGGRRNG